MPILPADVGRVFDDTRIRELAKLARLPAASDLPRFGKSVRTAVSIYIARGSEPSLNELHREIAALHNAAERREYERLIGLIERMTPAARRMTARRQEIIEARRKSFADRSHQLAPLATMVPDWHVPDASELRDEATREAAADGLRLLLSVGATFKARKRPSGKPTVSLVPMLNAPRPSRAEPRTKAERTLVMWLQMAVAETGAKVAFTARAPDASRAASPMVRFVARVLVLAGAYGEAGVAGRAARLINDIHEMRLAGQRCGLPRDVDC